MKKPLLALVVFALAGSLSAQISTAKLSLGSDLAVFSSYSLAAPEQMVGGTDPGTYFDKKNGVYLNGDMLILGTDPTLWDGQAKLNFRSRSGSPYLPLSTLYAAGSDSAISLDSAWLSVSLAGVLHFNNPFDLKLKGGKFQTSAGDLSVSAYRLENVQSMVKTANAVTVGLIASLVLQPAEGTLPPTMLSLEFNTNSLFEEALPQLYDTDGTMSQHGLPVLGAYVPQLFGDLRLSDLHLGFADLAAAFDWAMNGSSINSGNSFGLGSKLVIQLAGRDAPAKLTLPISLDGAYYEKNIDALAGLTGTLSTGDSTDFRETWRLGLGVGFAYEQAGVFEGKLTVSGSYNRIGHVYRDPLDLVNLGIDAQVRLGGLFFVGGGLVLGSLNEPVWQTAAGVAVTKDDYSHKFALAENLGFEAFVGLDVSSSIQVSAGFYDYAGTSLAYGIKRAKDGVVKNLQAGTVQADGQYQAIGIFLAVNFKL